MCSGVAGSEDYVFTNYELADDAKKFEKNDYNFYTRVPKAEAREEVGGCYRLPETLQLLDSHSTRKSTGKIYFFLNACKTTKKNLKITPPKNHWTSSLWANGA